MSRMNKWALCVAGVAVGAALVAAAPGVQERPTSDPFTVGCYDSLDQQANTTIVAYTPQTHRLSPEELCTQEWASQGHPAHHDLVTCVVDGGGTGVFATNDAASPADACGSIGAATAGSGRYGAMTASQVRAFGWNLGRRYEATWSGNATCSASSVLEDVATEAIAQSPGRDSWTVRVDEASDCAHFTIDVSAAEVVITAG